MPEQQQISKDAKMAMISQFLGFMLDAYDMALVLIMAPILYPMACKLGVNPIHMGILMAVNMEVGMCHPPVGLNLYVASGITKMGISELTVAVWPWLLTMIGFLILVTYWPTLSLWLPQLLMH